MLSQSRKVCAPILGGTQGGSKMKAKAIAIPALTIALAASAGWMTTKAYAAPAQPAAGFYQERGWDEPPEEMRDAQRKGFHEGIEAARHDFDRHSRKDADDH